MKITVSEQLEYQTVILAALLHDVGKMLHRGKESYEGKHEKASEDFLDNHAALIRNDKLYNFDLLKLLVRHHHSLKSDTQGDAYFDTPGAYGRERAWRLVSLVIDADCYSCSERNLDQQRRRDEKRRAPLDSIFANISLDLQNPETSDCTRYHLGCLDPITSFPCALRELSEEEITRRIKAFESDIPDFSACNDFDKAIITWLDILERHMWAVPSDTRYEVSDVSLYDHLRSSAALAACLYKRHINEINAGKNLKRANEIRIIGGDFSGIQNYIFSIANRKQSGLSKRLRARSFFISAFCETAIHRLLHTLDLPPVCNVFSAGGKFLLLAPCTDDSKDRLELARQEIEAEIHRNHFNQFSLLLCQRELKNYRDKAGVKSFFKLADEIFHALETEKTYRSRSSLLAGKDGPWNPAAFVNTVQYESYAGENDCPVCGRGPAVCEESAFDDGEETAKCCVICHRDKYVIGQKLPKAGYLAFRRGDGNGNGAIPIFADKNYQVRISAAYPLQAGAYLIQRLGNDAVPRNNTPLGSVRRYLANHVPTEDGEILTFEELAAKSLNNQKGSELLGVLKADIDNLGLIFSKGFEKRAKPENDVEDDDYKTMSRFLTLSRMTELFFSGWVKEIMEQESMNKVIAGLAGMDGVDRDKMTRYMQDGCIDFRDIYTVYSGGDDMLLVGPWETMIVFSLYLNQQFRRFTCNNRDITLSAGLAFVKPRFPIAGAVRQADELLEKSKGDGKNRISLFGTTVEWQQLPELVEFFLKLDERVKDDSSKIKTAFLHRLLTYHGHAIEFMEQGKVDGLRYLSLLSYDMGRNMLTKDKRKTDDFMLLERLITAPPSDNNLMKRLKIPLFWTLYGNR